MKNIFHSLSFSNIRSYVVAHKVITGIIVVTVGFGGYKLVQHISDTSGQTRYVLDTVQRGTISSTVSASGQVSASSQIDLKTKTSGNIVSVRVKAGDQIASGALIASVDSTDAGIALRDAQISLEKLSKPTDEATLIQARSALVDAQNAESTNYTTTLTDAGSTMQDFPAVIDGLNDLLYGTSGYLNDQNVSSVGGAAVSYKTTAGIEFDKAKREVSALNDLYATVNGSSNRQSIDNLAAQTLSTVKDLLTALKDSETGVNYIRTIQLSSSNQGSVKIATSVGSTVETNLATWTNQMSTHANALTADTTAIQNAPSNVAAKQSTLDTLTRGADPLDIESAKLAVDQKQVAYNDSFVVAPFSGVVAKVDVKTGDSVSTGATVATFVTKDQVAVVSLNEVDIAKVKTGDKAMLTFDAVSGLQISGVLSELDQVGTVTQGVVSYSAKITFDTGDPRILPGMSVTASIITDSKPDVLIVPTSAVRTSNGSSYVLVFDTPLSTTAGSAGVPSTVAPRQQPVQVGLSDDSSTEIISGLSEGDQIVTRTILPSTTAAAASAPSLLGNPRGGGGGARIGGTRIGG